MAVPSALAGKPKPLCGQSRGAEPQVLEVLEAQELDSATGSPHSDDSRNISAQYSAERRGVNGDANARIHVIHKQIVIHSVEVNVIHGDYLAVDHLPRTLQSLGLSSLHVPHPQGSISAPRNCPASVVCDRDGTD